mgnify:CR=1 FL=1
MQARIYKPAKTAMQSGKAKSSNWVLEFVSSPAKRSVDPLMGWTSSADTNSQVKLTFETREEAIAYAFKYDEQVIIEGLQKVRVGVTVNPVLTRVNALTGTVTVQTDEIPISTIKH